MTLPAPIDWQTLENTIQAWVADVSGVAAIWGDQHAPGPADPYIAMTRISAWSPISILGQRRTQTLQPEIRAVTVVTSAEPSYSVTLAGVTYTYLTMLGDTPTDIRDGLIVLIDGDPPELDDWDIVTEGAATLVYTADDGLPIDTLVSTGITTEIRQYIALETTANDGRVLFEFQAVVASRTAAAATYQNAGTYLERIMASRDLRSWSFALWSAGLTIEAFQGPVDLSAIDQEIPWSRAALTLVCRVTATVSEDTQVIETVMLENALGE